MEFSPGTKFLICEAHAVEAGQDVVQFFIKSEKQKPCMKCFTPIYFQTRAENICVKCWEKQYCKVIENDDGKFLMFKPTESLLLKL
jgi:hypothetical protein